MDKKRARKEERKNRKICFECSKYINIKKDKYVVLSTINCLNSPDEHAYFHFPCWVDYFNKRVENKMRAVVQGMQSQAVKLFENPEIKSLLKDIKGSDIALNMLQIPLNTGSVVSIDKVVEKIQNDRKRAKRNPKSKEKKGVRIAVHLLDI